MFDTSDLIPVMNRSVDDIAEMLAVSSSAAQPLLRHHKWVKDRLLESYTNNSDKEIQNAGVFHRCTERLKSEQTEEEGRGINVCTANNNDNNDNKFCPICFDEEIKPDDMFSMPCGHEFCLECWACQMKTKMEDGPSCILVTCPQAKCNEIVTEEEVAKVAPDLLEKFRNYQLRNFVDMNGTSRWCPGPGCDRIAAITAKNGSLVDADSIIATCDKCTTVFCIKCGNEPHQPMLCAALDKWKEECKNESETANWILANTKPCPKCRSRIEKNQGCNHMTCQQCKYEFCWICSGDWKEHGTNTGGYYNCNKFNENEDGTDDQSDAAKLILTGSAILMDVVQVEQKNKTKRELDRYLHYYKRYHAHAEAQKFAMKQLKETETKMMMLQECRTDHVTWSDVEFLKTANEQLVECRRVLKFTYVFAYYLTTPPKNNAAAAAATAPKKNDKKGRGKKTKEEAAEEIKEEIPMSKEEQTKTMQKERVEYHQEMLERFTENFSELVEKPLKEIDRQQVINQVYTRTHTACV